MAALACGVLSLSSCSDDADGIVAENQLKPLSLTVSSESSESSSTTHGPLRAGMSVQYTEGGTFQSLQSLWYSEDVVWAYSSKTKAYNKLESVASGANTYGGKVMGYASGNNPVSYEAGEKLILFNCGVQDESIQVKDNNSVNLKLSRSTNDNDMVIVYGDGNGTPYSDAGCPFSLRRSSATVGEDGQLTPTEDNASAVSFLSATPKLMLEIPALDANDVKELSKLTFKIIVSLSDYDEEEGSANTGFPKTANLKFLSGTASTLKGSNVFSTKNYSVDWGESLKVKFTESGTGSKKTSTIWKTATGDDQFKGYVFIPVPCIQYGSVTVKVRVECPSGTTTTLSDLCKTYTFTYNKAFGSADINVQSNVAKVFELGQIWTRSNASGAKPSCFGTGADAPHWVVSEND